MTRQLAVLCVLFLCTSASVRAQADRSYVPLSLSYSFPGGALADSFDIKSGLGFSLGYQYALDRNWRVGAKGTWMWSKLGSSPYGDLSQYAATYYQILASVTWRTFKHGWSPYLQGEGGLGFINLDEVVANMPIKVEGASAVRGSVGGSVGVLVPLSPALDVDVSGRFNYLFTNNRYTILGVHVGVVYLLNP
ncbi:MAG: outer membrane beta-barrel protein [Candidatus Kapabacteria bacterium]|nr:outer membrane beta-barrel protein [Candidatus Kapabacteria bacterium]